MKIFKKAKAKTIFVNIYKTMFALAPFGLILSVIFFMVQAKESKDLVGNLKNIEQSLSTRHIGIFPDYLNKINELLSEAPKDTSKIIIFEDILFYGALYNGAAFKEMVQRLVELSIKKKIVIVHYDNSENWLKGKMFREVIQESWMYQEDLSKLAQERSRIVKSLPRKGNARETNFYNLIKADSIASEIYFARYRDNAQNDRRDNFLKRQRKILQYSFYNAAANDNLLFKKIDEIKNTCFNKDVKEITFHSIKTMYNQITEELKLFFHHHNIVLIPLNNYLTMSCWSNGEKVLFAFPGRYGSEEIGFISQDRAILDYINTMLEGVENDNKYKESEER